MRSARLRHAVSLQRNVTVQDAYGQKVEQWQTIASVWAGVEPSKGREWFAAQQINATTVAMVLIRHRADVDTTCRVLHDDVVYDIEAVIDPDTRRRELQLMCKAVLQ